MFTSRAEYPALAARGQRRPAARRPSGRELGLVDDERWRAFEARREWLAAEAARLQRHRRAARATWPRTARSLSRSRATRRRYALLRRPGVGYGDVAALSRVGPSAALAALDAEARRAMDRQPRDRGALRGLRRAPGRRDRAAAPRTTGTRCRRISTTRASQGLSNEIREKLAPHPAERHRPGGADLRHDAGRDLAAARASEESASAGAPERAPLARRRTMSSARRVAIARGRGALAAAAAAAASGQAGAAASQIGGAERHRARGAPSAARRQRRRAADARSASRRGRVGLRTCSRDLYEGLVGESPNGDLDARAPQSRGPSARTARRTCSTCAASARWSNGDPVTAHDFVFGLRRARRSEDAHRSTRFILTPDRERRRDHGRANCPPERARRPRDRRLHARDPAREPDAVFPGAARALDDLSRASRDASKSTATSSRGPATSSATARSGSTSGSCSRTSSSCAIRTTGTTPTRSSQEVWFYPTEDLTAELQRYRANELDLTDDHPDSADPLDPREPRRRARDRAVPRQLLLRLQHRRGRRSRTTRSCGARCALAVDRDIITKQILGPGEMPGVRLGAAGARTTRSQQMAEAAGPRSSARPRRSGSTPKPATRPTIRCARRSCTTRTRTTAASPSRSRRCGSRCSASRPRSSNQEWKVFLDTRNQKMDTQVFGMGWIGDYNDAFTFSEMLRSTAGQNDTGYNNPEYDRLARRGAEPSSTRQARAELLRRPSACMLADMPIIPLYYLREQRLVKPWVGGYEPNIMDHHRHKYFYVLEALTAARRLARLLDTAAARRDSDAADARSRSSFFMMRAAPGGPFDRERQLLPEIEANLRAAYHLDEPLYQQFGRYLWGLAALRLRAVVPVPRLHASPSSSWRASRCRCGSARARCSSRCCSASRPGASPRFGRTRRRTTASWPSSMTGISIPNFVMAPLLVLVFAIYLRWLPAGGFGDGSVAQPRAARHGARAAADRVPRAADARQHDRGAAQQFRPHRARAGPADVADRRCGTR